MYHVCVWVCELENQTVHEQLTAKETFLSDAGPEEPFATQMRLVV
jgi:hypothetical protein